VGEEMAMGSVRIGLGKSNTADQVTMLVDDLKRVVARLREISAA
jgi:cysteine sulfinate desulfinase/cysteine desulfurase-like protein